MAIRPILMWPDPLLALVCTPVDATDLDVSQLVRDLFGTMYSAEGRGLAAPQIGVLSRVFVIDVTWKEAERTLIAFINPTITAHSDTAVEVMEQCLSIPHLPMPVTRPSEIDLSWDLADGTRTTAHFTGNEARCIQHELDHLIGRVIFDHQLAEDRAALEAAYAP